MEEKQIVVHKSKRTTESVCMDNSTQRHSELTFGFSIPRHKHAANNMCPELVSLNGGCGGLFRGHFFKGKWYYPPKGIRLQTEGEACVWDVVKTAQEKHCQADRNSGHLLAALATDAQPDSRSLSQSVIQMGITWRITLLLSPETQTEFCRWSHSISYIVGHGPAQPLIFREAQNAGKCVLCSMRPLPVPSNGPATFYVLNKLFSTVAYGTLPSTNIIRHSSRSQERG